MSRADVWSRASRSSTIAMQAIRSPWRRRTMQRAPTSWSSTMIDVVERTAAQVFIPLTVGGGIRTVEDMYRMLRAGADKISINTAAVLTPNLIEEGAKRFGSQCIVLSIDARRVARTEDSGLRTELEDTSLSLQSSILRAGRSLHTPAPTRA